MALIDIFDEQRRRNALKLWSNWLAILAGSAAAWIVDNQQLFLTYVHEIPQPWRSIATFAAVAGIPIFTASLKQAKLQPKPGDDANG